MTARWIAERLGATGSRNPFRRLGATSNMVATVPAVVGALVVGSRTGLAYRDATRTGVARPRLWAGFVLASTAGALALVLFVPTVPLPGLLVLASLGPVLYALERDDARHGAEPADPTRLPSQRAGGDADARDEPK